MTNFVAVFTTAADRNAVIAELTRLREENARLRAQLDEAQFALRGAHPLVKAMVMSAQLNGTGLEASYQPVLNAINAVLGETS